MVIRGTWSLGSYFRICWYSAMAWGTLPCFRSFCAASTYLLLLYAIGELTHCAVRACRVICLRAEPVRQAVAVPSYASRARKRKSNNPKFGVSSQLSPLDLGNFTAKGWRSPEAGRPAVAA